ncbi:MAG: UDP-2,4-diacetamido-2,4,6-trideoxy-beta-L-altropyranose hydrolase [Thiovulaceae bacterium]|nr:UDP-2,4-diacetamido-2,4,6-trideoxy-beta-L-altropyranose hydrolase [Sulfurimonadaceae bacterium]
MNILLRADSSSTIGTGHIMRDLVLATQYKDANIIFATQDLHGNINHKIEEAGYKRETLHSNNIDEVINLIKLYSIDMIVIDHYGIDYRYEKELKTNYPTLQIMSFDDTYERHDCDILLNHNISANKKRYKELVPKNCELRCGGRYTLLRDEFYTEKKKKRKKETSFTTVFIAMGGADTANLNIRILKVLRKFKNIKVDLLTTTANKNLNELKKYCKNKKWIALHVNSNQVAKLMKKSDFAVVTPSVTVNEVYFMKLPFIAIKTAENQDDMYRYLKREKYSVLDQFDKNKFASKADKLLRVVKK